MSKWLEWVDVKDDLPPEDPERVGLSIPVKIKWVNRNGDVRIGARNVYVYRCFGNGCWYYLNSDKKCSVDVIAWTTDSVHKNWKSVLVEMPPKDKDNIYSSIIVRVKVKSTDKSIKLAFYDFYSECWVHPASYLPFRTEVILWDYVEEE